MELNQSNSRNSGLKVVVVILALLLMGSLAYVFKLQQDKDAVDSSLSKTLTEKESNVIFGGRLAEYRYYDMHQIIGSALKKASCAIKPS